MQNNKYYELTHQQKGIWYTEKMHPDTAVGIIAGTFRIKGNIDYKKLEKAINIFVRDNEAMRTRIIENAGDVKQTFAPYVPFEIETKDFSNNKIEDVYTWEKEETLIPLELVNAPLFKFTIIKIADDDGGYYIKLHHLIADAWSITLLANYISKIYVSLLNDTYTESSAPSYIDYIEKDPFKF